MHPPAKTETEQMCVGIWRLLEKFHEGQWAELFYAQPAEAAGSPRADYVVKMATDNRDAQVEGRRQMKTEAAAIGAVSHPNLIALLDTQLATARPYLVFPRLEGHTLAVWMDSAYGQPTPVCLWWLRQAAQALEALHAAGWLHGDIKPENLIVSVRGHLTLIDCGLAVRLGSAVDVNRFQGTPGFAAPEIASSEIVVAESDIYSLGVLFYQMLLRSATIPHDRELDLADLKLQQVAEPLIQLVERMIAPVPSQRPTASLLVEEIFRLEIETLGMHIQPENDAPPKAA